MVEVVCLAAATFISLLGMACLSLSIPSHWRQVTGVVSSLPSSTEQRRLRILGYVSLLTALMLCLAADHPSIAVLVWVMLLSLAANGVASILAWRQQWLKPLLSFFSRV